MRDSQKSKVYSGERNWGIHEKGQKFDDLEECQAWIERVWADKATRRQFPWIVGSRAPKLRKGARGANANAWEMGLGKWARVEGVMIHELAHSIHHRKVLTGIGMLDQRTKSGPCDDQAWHGGTYCRIYVALVRVVLGGDEATALWRELRKSKCKIDVNLEHAGRKL